MTTENTDTRTLQLVQTVCAAYGIGMAQLTQNNGRRPPNSVAMAKQVICYLNTRHGKAHYTVIMRLLGYADHTPVSKNIRRTRDIMSVDADFRQLVSLIERQLQDHNTTTQSHRMAA